MGEETKIGRIVDLIASRFGDRSVLLFTEYKATQALVMSALQARFGDGCVTFINGDGRAEGVRSRNGAALSISIPRDEAARRFQRGEVRFMVSTEAAGEGIDLQERCHTLIHVDLPWNPMRLHQRVGRVNRYGQQHAVEVVSLRNPSTVESRIWDCLNGKLERITKALANAMDDPEDMLQLVLGMTSGRDVELLFTESADVPRERLREWFDARAATFGGQNAIETVRNLLGSAARFDFGAASAGLPRVDLPDLLPFFKSMLALNHRQWKDEGERLSFKTPEGWSAKDFALKEHYERLQFRRQPPSSEDAICGVGHKVFDSALEEAGGILDVLAVLPGLTKPVAVLAVHDRVTTTTGLVRRVVFGVVGGSGQWKLLHDWELIKFVNDSIREVRALARVSAHALGVDFVPNDHTAQAVAWMEQQPALRALGFRSPAVDPIALLVPAGVESEAAARVGDL